MTPRFRCQLQNLEMVLRTCTPGGPELKIETPTVAYSCVPLTQARLGHDWPLSALLLLAVCPIHNCSS